MPTDTLLGTIPLASGAIFMLAGLVLYLFPPKRINPLYGYRTSSSMRSPERWRFAQKRAAREMMLLGAILAATSLLSLAFKPNEDLAAALGVGLMVAMVVVLVKRVERAIERRFLEE